MCLLLAFNANPMHLHPQTGNQLVHGQPIKVELILVLICSLLAQLGEPNLWL